MKIKLIGWIVIIFLVILTISGIWYVFSVPKIIPQNNVQPTTRLPVGDTITPISSSTAPHPSQTMTLATQNGSTIVTNDFIHNGVTIPDKVNEGHYLLAGNLGYCISNPQECQAAPTDNFTVYYNTISQSFTIELTKEPIGKSRLDMEQFMITALGIPAQQMCSLNYLISVTRYVNSQYTGKNLGFSFCPGAMVLPK